MKLKEEIPDADIAGGLIVCRSAYTRDTKLYARRVGIELVTLQEVQEDASTGVNGIYIGTLEINHRMVLVLPKIVSVGQGSRHTLYIKSS